MPNRSQGVNTPRVHATQLTASTHALTHVHGSCVYGDTHSYVDVYMCVLANYSFNFERKNRFSVAILNFFDQSGSRFFEPVFFFINHYYQT